VKDSFISHGVEVYGYVESSLLFPGVIIMKDAQVINSVILNNNKIGNRTTIKNTLILPFIGPDPNIKYNIEDNCQIGEISSSIKNQSFPEQVYGGVTALGMNVRIPRGYTIEPGCFIDAEITLNKIKQYPKLKRGKSIINS
jgi:ADP-glucose pyrophosphorylase